MLKVIRLVFDFLDNNKCKNRIMINKASNILFSLCVAFSTYTILTTLGPTVDHELVEIWKEIAGNEDAK